MPVATELPAGVDLDTITTDGDYTQTSSAEASSGTNYPAGIAGKLRVVTSSSNSMVWQKYTVYATNNPTEYVRTRYNGTWGQWRQMADMNDIAALANVYAAKVHGHSLTDANIIGTLPVNQGGTGATTPDAARTALAVPSTSVAINAGAGLSGGGTLAASRTLQVVFEGSGTKTTAARSDHGHALTDANITGILPVAQGGLGRTTAPTGYLRGDGSVYGELSPAGVLSDIGGAPANHGHSLTDTNITGTLPVNQGGTGATTQAAARTALGVPSTSTSITAGTGLTGGGNLSANRTISVVFAGTGSANTSARSDHGHSLTDANITGVLPVNQGGSGRTSATVGSYIIGGGTGAFGLKTPQEVLSDIGAAPSGHGHTLTDSNITGILPVAQGGTGATSAVDALSSLGAMPRDIEMLPTDQNINNWTTSGVFIPRNPSQVTTARGYPVNNAVVMLEHTQMAASYATQVITVPSGNQQFRRTNTNGTWSEWYRAARTPYRVNAGSASGWDIQTNGVSVVIHDDGSKGCSLEATMVRTDPSFTQGSSFTVHGYFVPSDLRPTHVGGQYFWCMIATAPGIGFIRWNDGQFSCRTDTAGVNQVINPGSRITFNLSWVV